ncbi:MAG: DUF3560 domain-containing protein [Clostridia bacterium]|nr:DUF3560 domain-containing protein [Clostridia bacterium]
MGGRADYEDRRQRRIERYEELSKKANEEAEARSNSSANRILSLTPGQPILIGHHSEKKHRRLIEKAHNDIKKSIELSDKSEYYKGKAESVSNSKAIYDDDPMAIQKLRNKLERLENERASIKAREHNTWELTNIGATIRETKKRIKRLEDLESVQFNDVEFKGGKIIRNANINRIQILFDDIPSQDIRQALKSRGFHWSRSEGAWQREFTANAIKTTKVLLKDVLNKENEEEFE